MSFAPALPLTGYAGWKFLDRTLATQRAAFEQSAPQQREADHVRSRMARVTSAADLVADRQLLRVALDAFGLGEDIDARAFIRRILEDGTENPQALANRLADRRYRAFAGAFNFAGPGPPATRDPDFADRLLTAANERRFEAAVGTRDEALRLALALQRDLGEVAAQPGTDGSKWFAILGTPPLRRVFETAFGLPKGFPALDLDRQVEILRDRSRRAFGTDDVAQFSDPARMEALTRRFLLQDQIAEASAAPVRGALALQLLRPAG